MTMIWNRTNTIIQVLVLLALLTVIAMLATDARGGPLDPPEPPASTDGIRVPGTPIASLPFSITQPGHYYLTRNLVGAASTNGITISSNSVTLDLMGFELRGTNSTGTAILVTSGEFKRSIVIRNGHIRGWLNGIDGTFAVYSVISEVIVVENGTFDGDGSRAVVLGNSSRLRDCMIIGNAGTGFVTQTATTVEDCTIIGNGGQGGVALAGSLNRVANNTIINNSASVGGDVFVQGNTNVVSDNAMVTLRVTGSGNQFTRNRFCVAFIGGLGNFLPNSAQPEGNLDGDDC